MSREHCWEAGDLDITHMCGLYPFAIGKIDRELCHSGAFVVNIRILHDKN
jgi:hypothetical protein